MSLGRTPDGCLAIFRCIAHARVGFDIPLMNHRRHERAFDDHVGFDETRVDISSARLGTLYDVGRRCRSLFQS